MNKKSFYVLSGKLPVTCHEKKSRNFLSEALYLGVCLSIYYRLLLKDAVS